MKSSVWFYLLKGIVFIPIILFLFQILYFVSEQFVVSGPVNHDWRQQQQQQQQMLDLARTQQLLQQHQRASPQQQLLDHQARQQQQLLELLHHQQQLAAVEQQRQQDEARLRMIQQQHQRDNSGIDLSKFAALAVGNSRPPVKMIKFKNCIMLYLNYSNISCT